MRILVVTASWNFVIASGSVAIHNNIAYNNSVIDYFGYASMTKRYRSLPSLRYVSEAILFTMRILVVTTASWNFVIARKTY